jgi:hypothetical protein
MRYPSLSSILLLVAGRVAVHASSLASSDSHRKQPQLHCFPFGSATLNKDFKVPDIPRDEWWCPQAEFYGFLGFSYPIEYGCDQEPDSLIDADFAEMKKSFGASMVRVYLPGCYTDAIWEELLEAGVKHDMAVVVQVAWPLNGDPVRNFSPC